MQMDEEAIKWIAEEPRRISRYGTISFLLGMTTGILLTALVSLALLK